MLTAPFQIAYLCVLIEISHWLAWIHLACSGGSIWPLLGDPLRRYHPAWRCTTLYTYAHVYMFMHGAPKKADRLCYLQSFSHLIGFLKMLYELPLIAQVLFFLKWCSKVNISSLLTSGNDTMFSSCLWRWIFCSLTGPMELLASLKPTPEDGGSTQITSNNYLPQKLSESSGGVASWFNTFAPLKNSIAPSEYWLDCFSLRERRQNNSVLCEKTTYITKSKKSSIVLVNCTRKLLWR